MKWETLAAVAALTLMAAPSRADTDVAAGCEQSFDPILRIQACTEIIDAGQAQGAELASAHRNRAQALDLTGYWSEALTDYDTAIEINPDDPAAYFARHGLLALMERYGEATVDLDHVIRLQPDHAEAYYWRGLLHVKFERHARAVEDLTRAIDLGLPESSVASATAARSESNCALGNVDAFVTDRLPQLRDDPEGAAFFQRMFTDLDLYGGEIDGVLDEETEAALRAFAEAGCPWPALGR